MAGRTMIPGGKVGASVANDKIGGKKANKKPSFLFGKGKAKSARTM